jgi:hypothetical protein
MTTYMVGYDLRAPGKKYDNLIAHLKTYSLWWHHLDSTWIIVTSDSATKVRDDCRAFIDSNDELLVAVISAPAAWWGFNEAGSNWLKSNL